MCPIINWWFGRLNAIRNICKKNISKHPLASPDKIKVGKKGKGEMLQKMPEGKK
jgi:hypothetical protein